MIFLVYCIVSLLHCVLASCDAVYCSRSCLWRAGGQAVFVVGGECLLPR